MIIRLHVRVSPGLVRLGMIGALLIGPAGELCSEPVTMTSYYPAPSGVYSQIVTTQNAYLARDGVSYAYVGGVTPFTPPSAPVTVPATPVPKLVVMPGAGNAGNVGIGTINPQLPYGAGGPIKMQVMGNGGGNVDMIVDGQMVTGDGNNKGGVWFNGNQPAPYQFVGQNQLNTTAVGFYNNANWGLTVTNGGSVGILNSSPNPINKLDVGGNAVVQDPCLSMVLYGAGTASCPANTYATWASGLYNQQQNGYTAPPFLTGQMLCCPCPATGCIF